MQPQPMVPTTGSTRNAAANAAPEDGLVSAGAKSALSAELPHTGLESRRIEIKNLARRRVGAASRIPSAFPQ